MPPKTKSLTTRQLQAAADERYVSLVQDDPFPAKLALYLDESKFAASIALGRLLPHFPVEVRRNVEVLRRLAEVAGMLADGIDDVDCYMHARGLGHLASHATQAGFALIVFPLAKYEELWSTEDYIGHLEGGYTSHRKGKRYPPEKTLVLHSGKTATEILVEAHEEHSAEDFLAAFELFLTQKKVTGTCLAAKATGEVELRAYEKGTRDEEREKELQQDALEGAARALDPVAMLDALGHGDLLASPKPFS